MSRTYRRQKQAREHHREPTRDNPVSKEIDRWCEEEWEEWCEEDRWDVDLDDISEEILPEDIPEGVGGSAVENLITSVSAAIAKLQAQQEERLAKPVNNRWIFDDIVRQTKNANYWRYNVVVRMTAWGELEFHSVGNNASHHFDIAWCEAEKKIVVRSQDCSDGDYHEPRFSIVDGDPGYIGHW